MAQINLTAPDQVKAGTPNYKIAAFVINPEFGFVAVELVSIDGQYRRSVRYNNAAALIASINTGNYSVNTLENAILSYLLGAGASVSGLSGTVA